MACRDHEIGERLQLMRGIAEQWIGDPDPVFGHATKHERAKVAISEWKPVILPIRSRGGVGEIQLMIRMGV
jgi:hypothetical protein